MMMMMMKMMMMMLMLMIMMMMLMMLMMMMKMMMMRRPSSLRVGAKPRHFPYIYIYTYTYIYIIKCALCNLFGSRNPAQIAVYVLQPFCLFEHVAFGAFASFVRHGLTTFLSPRLPALGLLCPRLEVCFTKPKEKFLLQQKLKKMFGKKAKIQECGNNYDGRRTICGCENQMSDVSKCCVPSFQAEWPHSPQRLGMGNAHTPRRLPLEHAADLPTFLLIEMWLSLRMARMRYCRELTGRN
jgi:hypothetical protein